MALADPVKNPLIYPQNQTQKEYFKNIEISLNNKAFLSILLKDGVRSYLGNVVNEAVKENIVTGWQIVAFSALHNRLADQVLAVHTQIEDAKKKLAPILESRKKAEGEKKAAENKVKEEEAKVKGKTPEIKIEGKIKGQMGERGWIEQDIKNTVTQGASGDSFDKRKPKNTDDGLGRDDPATVYGQPGKYVVVNDRTGEVTQVSDKTDPDWIDDSRIRWNNK